MGVNNSTFIHIVENIHLCITLTCVHCIVAHVVYITHSVYDYTLCCITYNVWYYTGCQIITQSSVKFYLSKGEEKITQASLVVLVTNMRCVIDWFPIFYKDT